VVVAPHIDEPLSLWHRQTSPYSEQRG
jgi:hypothetical protein